MTATRTSGPDTSPDASAAARPARRSRIQIQQRRDLIKLTAFLVVSAIFIVWLGIVMGAIRPGRDLTYHAVFDDVSGLEAGDQVRIAGVDVGKVSAVQVRKDSTVLVTFVIGSGNALNRSTTAVVQYKNLIGDRDLLLDRPDASAAVLPVGSTIPSSHTHPALDLDTLLDGFKPLFQGLAPAQINEVSRQLIGVLQGQSGAVRTLVSLVGSVTTTLGDRQQLITSVVNNLNAVLGTVDARRGTLGNLVDQLDGLVSGLNRQDTQVLDAASRIDRFARDTSSLLTRARGPLRTDLVGLENASRKLNGHAATLEALLNKLPQHYAKIQDTASYGNFFDFFLCGVRLTVSDPNGKPVQTPWIDSEAARCKR